jgi:large subunit ribosomal protein L1
MEQAKVLEAVKKLRSGEKRNFTQSVELIINFKEIDVKKEEGKLDEFFKLPAGRATKAKVCALVGSEMKDIVTKACDSFVLQGDFAKMDKRAIRKLVKGNDFFIAQANMMPEVAKTFGRFLSTVGKMPNPKLGQVVPPKANIEPLVKTLRESVKLVTKKAPVLQVYVGKESMSDEDLANNIFSVVEHVQDKLPQKQHNIKSVLIKTSMGRPVKL